MNRELWSVGPALALLGLLVLGGCGKAENEPVTQKTQADGDELLSGLQPGEFTGAFNVRDVTGEFAGRTLCYR